MTREDEVRDLDLFALLGGDPRLLAVPGESGCLYLLPTPAEFPRFWPVGPADQADAMNVDGSSQVDWLARTFAPEAEALKSAVESWEARWAVLVVC